MQTLFTKHCKSYPPNQTEVYELKICKGTSLPFDAIQDHQIQALQEAQQGSLFHKISDQPWGTNDKFRFTAKKPFDCFVLHKVSAYIVVWFYKERKQKLFIKIRIDKFLEMKKTCKRKSFTEEMALQNGNVLVIN